jgi:HK97 gp10 family phage protein
MGLLAKKLEQLPDRVTAGIRAAVEDETEAVADDMRRGAPRLTGTLASSIQAEVSADGLSGTAAATARHATFVEHGTSDTPEQPFATPAAERSRQRFPDRLRREIGGELKDLVR